MDSYILEVREGSGKLRVVPLDHFPFTIGRDIESDLSLPDRSTSRLHAWIKNENDELCIVDNDSRNGVYVNKERIVGPRKFRPGDRAWIGNALLRLARVEAPPAGESMMDRTVMFCPRPAEVDPIRTISTHLSGKSPKAPVSLRANVGWDALLRLLLEAPAPDMYEKVLDRVEESISFDRCFLIQFDREAPGSTKMLAVRARDDRNPNTTLEVMISREILKEVAKRHESVIVTQETPSFPATESFVSSGATTALCLPLIARGDVLGVLYLDRKAGSSSYSERDAEALGPLASLVALKVENAQLFEAFVSSQIDRRDLEIAESIQKKFIPREVVRLPGYSVEGFSQACRQVGGDCIDFIQAEGENGFRFVIGDVSGKGLPSALYMVGVLSTLRAHFDDDLPLDRLMGKLERYVYAKFQPDHFLTLFLGRLDAESGVLTFCNAGHMPPLVVRRDGCIDTIDGADPALNIVPCDDFRKFDFKLEPGDLFVVYTDGVIEAKGKDGSFYGTEGLLACLERNRDADLRTIQRTIVSEVEAFASDDRLQDDTSLILIRREAAAGP